MDLTEQELKDIENLLKMSNRSYIKKQKLNELEDDSHNKKLFHPKLSKNIYKKNNFRIKYPKIANSQTNINLSNNENKTEFTKSLLIESQKSNNNNYNKENYPNKESIERSKKLRSLKVKNILDQIRRKSNEKSPKSNLKLYDDLFPGPGSYNPNIGVNNNLRYKNLFLNNSNSKNSINLEKNSERNVGPGSYNPIENINYKSYSQNPKIFISSLERPGFINEHEINKDVGPGSYEVSSSFDKKNVKCLSNFSYSVKKENDRDKMKKLLQNELNLDHNTKFFNLVGNQKIPNVIKDDIPKKNRINKFNIYNIVGQNVIDNNNNISFKKNKLNSIKFSNKLSKKYFSDYNNNIFQNICITNDNNQYNI